MPLDQTNWKQETETKPDVFSLEGLIAWLETQPPEKDYCWIDAGECLYSQYARFLGMDYMQLCSCMLNYYGEPDYGEPRFGFLHTPSIARQNPQTFGAALSRARALLASRSDAYLAETRK